MLSSKATAALIAGALVVGVPSAVLQTSAVAALLAPSQPTVISKVVDGDTIDVSQGDVVTRVRLLNVDTPEANHANDIVQCLGLEATAFLRDLLPAGSEVTLEYDKERNDRYGRDLAGVFIGEQLVNAEIARAGLGVAVQFRPNTRFYSEVKKAESEARTAERGLHDETVDCSYPAAVHEFAQTAQQLSSPLESTDVEALESRLAEILAATALGAGLSDVIDSDASGFLAAAFSDSKRLALDLDQGKFALGQAKERTIEQIAAEEARLEQERLEAERLEQERLERERLEAERQEQERRAAEQRAAEQRAAEQRAAEQAAEQQRRAQSSTSSNSSSKPKSSPGSSGTSGGSKDTYTGCRAYGGKYPPNAIDSKGRPYTKIDCNTKLPRP